MSNEHYGCRQLVVSQDVFTGTHVQTVWLQILWTALLLTTFALLSTVPSVDRCQKYVECVMTTSVGHSVQVGFGLAVYCTNDTFLTTVCRVHTTPTAFSVTCLPVLLYRCEQVLFVRFYNNPAPLNGSMQFHYCTLVTREPEQTTLLF